MMKHNLHVIAGGILLLLGTFAAACDGDEDTGGEERQLTFAYVSWAEGIAMTNMMKVLVEDSLGYEVRLVQAGGAPVAFSSVAQGDADVFLDAWLPITHSRVWEEYGDRLVDLGPNYDSTEVGFVVPAYMEVQSVEDMMQYREELGGEIIGIESGAAINEQAERVIREENLGGFHVVASSGPAMTASLQRAYTRRQPIVVTGWKPHWMWDRFELRFVEGASTGSSAVFGEPENIHTLVRPGFRDDFPRDVVGLLDRFHLSDSEIASLMDYVRPDEEEPLRAAREWIEAHPEVVRQWFIGGSDSTPEDDPAQR